MQVHAAIINDSLMSVNTDSLIPSVSVLISNMDMKTCDEVRRDNLALLIKEAGGIAQLAEKYECTEAAIKTMLRAYKDSKSGTPKGIGTVAARKLETCMHKERGWLDQDRTAPRLSLSSDEDMLLTALSFISHDMRESWMDAARMAIERETAQTGPHRKAG